MKLVIIRSPRATKKWRVQTPPGVIPKRHIDFGQRGASDYTVHKDAERMRRYVVRHGGSTAASSSSTKESWGAKSGLWTAGFWSRWLLWSRPSLAAAKKLISSKFGITLTSSKAASAAKAKKSAKKRAKKASQKKS
jgi:hypothetical protein